MSAGQQGWGQAAAMLCLTPAAPCMCTMLHHQGLHPPARPTALASLHPQGPTRSSASQSTLGLDSARSLLDPNMAPREGMVGTCGAGRQGVGHSGWTTTQEARPCSFEELPLNRREQTPLPRRQQYAPPHTHLALPFAPRGAARSGVKLGHSGQPQRALGAKQVEGGQARDDFGHHLRLLGGKGNAGLEQAGRLQHAKRSWRACGEPSCGPRRLQQQRQRHHTRLHSSPRAPEGRRAPGWGCRAAGTHQHPAPAGARAA